jgi:dienelactone hydrolase
MFHDVVLQDTRAEDWPAMRSRIRQRVLNSMGKSPEVQLAPSFEIVQEYEAYGLKHQKIRFSVLPGEFGLAVIVLPKGAGKSNPAPAVVLCHGTYGWKHGKSGPLCLERLQDGPWGPADCGYAIELAQRGFVTVVPDNYKCGELLTGGEKISEEEFRTRRKQVVEQFAKDYPEWSFDGRRLLHHQRLLDVMDRIDFIQPRRYGVMGHSLGGRTAINLSALDERITVSIPSAGISPMLTNVPSNLRDPLKKPPSTANETASWFPYDYQDMIALNAPRPLLILEAYNDGLNSRIEADFECFMRGQKAYALLGKPECFSTLIHGDGHATLPDVRDFAYRWLERWLPTKQSAG